jgi:GNAT superfamily N-acetyltransferase
VTENVGSIVSTTDRRDLVPVVANWLWDEFGRANGRTLEQVNERIAGFVATVGLPRAFVLLLDGVPAGTASYVAQDLEDRPDLTPWLAGVVVAPAFRGRGLAASLVRAVEDAARADSVSTLWLYTWSAERVYARIGWRTVEHFERRGVRNALMVREL